MAHLIDKSEIAAEIEKMLQEEYPCDNSEQTTGYHCALYELQDFLNSLEVKEVDLEKEVHKFIDKEELHLRLWDVDRIAKHFFELGLKAKGE